MTAKPAKYETQCNATAIRMASRRLTALYDSTLEPSGLRSTQYAILALLHRFSGNPPTLSELADMLAMDRSALGHTLRPLERDRLIALRKCAEDRRRVNVVLTKAGEARFEAAKPLWKEAQDRFNVVYGTREATRLRAILLDIAYDERLISSQI
jgi:DNA-binding MarR family transcriptional regulator